MALMFILSLIFTKMSERSKVFENIFKNAVRTMGPVLVRVPLESDVQVLSVPSWA
jgi:hypothetical protein